MKILLTGANGQLGIELGHRASKQGFEVIAVDIDELDITNPSAVAKGVRQGGISLVINAAAYTAVDQAESEPALAFAVNRDGPAYLASACDKAGIPLIHISTDYVFDGRKKEPYLETDPVSPLGVYGKSKAAGEIEVRARLQKHIILRTSWLYGNHGNNFVKTMLRLGREREVLQVVDDQYGCPTYSADLAEAVLSLVASFQEMGQIPWGTCHYCGKGVTTWYSFAKSVLDIEKQYESLAVNRLEPITTSDYPTPAKRPSNSALNCSLITKTFCINPRP